MNMSIKSDKKAKKACVVTFGCQQNEADSEKIKGVLASMGYSLTGEEFLSECDVIIMNTCAIREHAELKAFSRTGQLKHYKKTNKDLLIGLCGCMVEQEHRAEHIKRSFPYVDFLFGTHSLHKFPEILQTALTKRKRQFVREPEIEDAREKINAVEALPIYRENKFKANVSVMYGCNNFCSYCVVPYVRGRERSRDKANILAEIRGLIADGCKDITLLGQNVNSYQNGEYKFTSLLADIEQIDGDYLIRFMTSHPKDVPDELIELMGHSGKLANHFHLPIQSGSNRILQLMNRGYTREYYLELVDKLRSSVKDIAITTDIIVGFPTETDEDFEDTLNIIETVGFDNIYPFIYSRRKNTPAAEMADDISKEDKNKRFDRLIKLQNAISLDKNRDYEGKTVRVLVESRGKNDENAEQSKQPENNTNKMSGRTSTHKLVLFDGDDSMAGTFVDVKIKEGKLACLIGG